MFLLELVLKLLEALQSLVHIHVLSCGILNLLVEGAEILLRVTEMLQMLGLLLLLLMMLLAKLRYVATA